MEPIFENETVYTKELYDKYIKFHSKKYGVQDIIGFISLIVVILIITIRRFDILKWKILIIWILVLLGIYIYKKRMLKTKEQYKNIAKSMKTVKYKFYEKYFETSYQGEIDKIYYIRIKNVFELPDRYYLYLDANHACVVLKSKFTKGTSEDFKTFLNTKLLFKIKKVNANKK